MLPFLLERCLYVRTPPNVFAQRHQERYIYVSTFMHITKEA